MNNHACNKIHILFMTGNNFAGCKVVNFETPSCGPTGVFIANGNEPFFPAARQNSRFFTDTVRIIAESIMEG